MNNDEKNLNSASDENKSADTYMNVEENKTDRTDTEDNDGMNNIDKNNQSAGNEQHTSKTLKRKKKGNFKEDFRSFPQSAQKKICNCNSSIRRFSYCLFDNMLCGGSFKNSG